MECIDTRGYDSDLAVLFQHVETLPADDRQIVVAYLSIPESDLASMAPLQGGLEEFMESFKHYENFSILRKSAQILIGFIERLQIPAVRDLQEQCDLYDGLRSSVPWLPFGPLEIGVRRVPFLVLMSYYRTCMPLRSYLMSAEMAKSYRCHYPQLQAAHA